MVKTWALCLPWAKLPREDWHSWLGEDPILSFGRAWVWGEKDIVWLMGQPPFWCVTLDELLHFLSSRFLLCNMGIIKCYIPRLGREKWVLSKCQLRKQVCGGCVSWPNLRAGKWHKPNWSQDWLTLTFMISLQPMMPPGRLASKHEAVGRSQSRGVTQIELCFERKMLTEVWRMKERQTDRLWPWRGSQLGSYVEPGARSGVLFICLFQSSAVPIYGRCLDWVNIGIMLCDDAVMVYIILCYMLCYSVLISHYLPSLNLSSHL